ncbi:MAG: DNA methyltransferase [Chloroflexota bacterium]
MIDNTLYYGDNLDILRNPDYFPDECVDLIYLDPPFNSSRNYNVLFADQSGKESEAQITAFEDTWEWGPTAQQTYEDIVRDAPYSVSKATEALYTLIQPTPMLAYLVMMTARLVELHRVLKPTGSLYLHCDPTASHYLKIILDSIFGADKFVNEIIWKRSQPKSHASQIFSRSHDVLLFYKKSDDATFNTQYMPHDPEYVEKFYRYIEEDSGRRYRVSDLTNPNKNRPNLTYEFPPDSGTVRVWRWTKERMQKGWEDGIVILPPNGKIVVQKRYLDEMEGTPVTDVWDDIEHLHGSNKETLGYPTQKPVALLERIIEASSNPGDVVLDPFCGCGTAVAAAQKLGRRWRGIDITHLSTALLKYRLEDMFDIRAGRDYKVVGEPTTVDAARELATDKHNDGRYQFQFWALSLVRAKPLGGQTGGRSGKRGSDKGIDGTIAFNDGDQKKPERVLIQVKSGKVKSGDIRDLVGTVEREKAALGVFITLEPPSKDMTTEALTAGTFTSKIYDRDYRKIQILTIEDLLDGAQIDMPSQSQTAQTFKRAERINPDTDTQKPLL